MALSVDVTYRNRIGRRAVVEADVTPDDSWLAAGESLSPRLFGLTHIDYFYPLVASGYAFEYDYDNEKLLAYYADYSSGTDGALIAVPDLTDLSTVPGALKVRVEGH